MSAAELRNKYSKKYIALLMIILSVILMPAGMKAGAEAEEQKAEDIIRQCTVASSSRNTDYTQLWNNKYSMAFTVTGGGEQYIEVDLEGNTAQAIYIRWGKNPPQWRLECTLRDGRTVTSDWGKYGYHQEYADLPKDTASFRIITEDGNSNPLRIVELEVYTPGVLPKSVHIWQPTPKTAEVLMVSTHQDDEILFFGGAIPYYSGELGYDTVIAYMAYDNDLRIHEALEGLWTCGARQQPLFLGFTDKYCTTLEKARTIWDENRVTLALTELIVRYRPQVVITQDVNGEYGHGQHLLTVHCLQNALYKAENSDYIANNLPEYKPWTVSKCYLHLYWKKQVIMPWGDLKLASAGGKTALQVARDAFLCHASQQKFNYVVGTTKETYDCRKFGLYRTTVGDDTEKKDFFENITLRYTNIEPEEDIPSWLERTGLRGWHYRVVNSNWQHSEYLRYCTAGGVTGWYEADVTGSLTEPVNRVELVIDGTNLDLADYHTLLQIGDNPRVFSYSYGVLIQDMPVRYCSVGDGELGFHVVKDAGGEVLLPAQQIHVFEKDMEDLRLPELTLQNERTADAGKTAIIILSSLLVLTAFALSISVARLSAANRRRAKNQRRRHPDRPQRYR